MTGRNAVVPTTLTAKVGDTVVWKNDSPGVHNVADKLAFASAKQDASMPAGTAPFNSGPVEAGKQYSYTFAAHGIYKYFCFSHEADGMVGTIVVTK
jgi:plastocyanin